MAPARWAVSREAVAVTSGRPEVGLGQPLVTGQLGERTLSADPPQFHEVDVVRQPTHDVEVVLHDAHLPAPRPKRLDEFEHHIDPLLIDPGDRKTTRLNSSHA